jgi:hypothetical protein
LARDVSQLPSDKELENIRKAIKAIGESKLPLNKALINDIKIDLVEKGYDAAVVHAEQAYLAADVNAEIVRVLTICRHYGLSPEAAAQVLDSLSKIL